MQCNEVRESLVAYLDDEVVAEERERIDSHLASCPACRMEQAGLDSTGDLLRLLGRDADSKIDLAARVIAEASNPWCGHIRRKRFAFATKGLGLPCADGGLQGGLQAFGRFLAPPQIIALKPWGRTLADRPGNIDKNIA